MRRRLHSQSFLWRRRADYCTRLGLRMLQLVSRTIGVLLFRSRHRAAETVHRACRTGAEDDLGPASDFHRGAHRCAHGSNDRGRCWSAFVRLRRRLPQMSRWIPSVTSSTASSTRSGSRTWLSTEPGDSPRGLHCENRLNVQMDSGELHQLMRKVSGNWMNFGTPSPGLARGLG